jgi:hypothetical protein
MILPCGHASYQRADMTGYQPAEVTCGKCGVRYIVRADFDGDEVRTDE